MLLFLQEFINSFSKCFLKIIDLDGVLFTPRLDCKGYELHCERRN